MSKKTDKIIRRVDRIVSGSLGKQIVFFLVIAIVIFVILTAISVAAFSSMSPDVDFNERFWNMVLNFIDPGAGFAEYPGNSERILILITNLFGMIIFNGILIALLVTSINQRIEKINNGEVYYSFNNHVVVIGYDHICDELVELLAQQNEFVLQTSRDVSEVRHDLFDSLHDKFKNKVTVVSGNRASYEDVKKLNIHKCVQVFILGDMDDETQLKKCAQLKQCAHDSKNIECLTIINKIISEVEPGKNLRCHMLFKHPDAFAAFQQQEIPGIRSNIDFVPFNFYEMWAQKVFVKNSYNSGETGGVINYKPLDHEPIKEDSQMRVHLVILGMSNMGIALGIQAAQICHFPNYVTKGIKTLITFIDENADNEMQSLKTRFSFFFDEVDHTYECFADKTKKDNKEGKQKFTDIEFEFIKAHFEDDAVRDYLIRAAGDKNSFLTIASTMPDSSAALSTALYLPVQVFDSGASVFVRQKFSHAIVSMLSNGTESEVYRKYKNMRPFGMIHNCYDLTEADDILPMMIKYVYDNTSFNEEKTVKTFDKNIIKDYWNKWESSQNISALKASNRYAANFIRVKQRSLGIKEGVDLDKNQICLAAQIEHNRWVAEKLLIGFRAPTPEETAGITKEKRENLKARFIHPDIKAYGELGEDAKNVNVKLYDINISNALPYMLKALNNKA